MHTSTKRFTQRCRVFATLLVLAAAGAARAAAPDVLNQVPGDAYGVIVINNIRALGVKVANAGTRLDLPVPPDPVAFVTQEMGIKEGFDPNNSAALVLLKPTADQGEEGYFANGSPPAVGLLPTTNSKIMLEPFKPSEPDKDGISEISLPDNPEQHAFVATVATKWVAIAQKKEDLRAYIARGPSFAKTASPSTLKIFDGNDLVVWTDIGKISTGADKWLDDRKTEVAGMLELQGQVGQGDPLEVAVAHAGVAMVFDFAKEFLKDSKAGLFSMRLTDSGATFGISGDFKPDSPIGKFVAAQGGQGNVSLQGLPGGNNIAAGAFRMNGESLKAPLTYFVDQLSADPKLAQDPRLAEFRKSFDLARQEFGLIQGMSFVLLDPAAGGKNGFLNGSFLIDSNDPQKLLDLQLESLKTGLAAQSLNADLKQTVTVSPNAVTIKGVKLNKVTVKVDLREETPEKPIPQEARMSIDVIKQMYGPDGLTGYLGIVGKRVVMIYGTDNVTLESSIAAAQGNTDDLDKSKEIADMKDQIVANPIAVAYLPIARWVNLVPQFAGPALGVQVPPPGPAPAKPVPPIVASVGVSGSTMTAELHLPIATITGVQEAVRQMEQALQGGGNAAPPAMP